MTAATQNFLVFGNSGSGKSTLARRLAEAKRIAHLDLDTVAWASSNPPQRHTIATSQSAIETFVNRNPGWVIEGCYTDLLTLMTPRTSHMIYLDLSVQACIQNAKKRPWEPHKYASKQQQDDNLNMLIDWIAQYPQRQDSFSQAAQQHLFANFNGTKSALVSNQVADDFLLSAEQQD